MKMNRLALVALALVGFAFTKPASAGVHIEPYLGYGMGKAGGSTTSNIKGPGYGARLGYGMLGFSFGAEYMGSSFEDDQTPKTKGTNTDLGAYVAYKFPVLVRAYATYFFSSKMKLEGTTGDFEGKGMKVGVGFTGLPFVSINLEYYSTAYNKWAGNTITPEITAKTTMLTVSLPLDF